MIGAGEWTKGSACLRNKKNAVEEGASCSLYVAREGQRSEESVIQQTTPRRRPS